MHRRFLKLKVMAALFSAAFLLGAVDAGAFDYQGDLIVNNDTNLEICGSESYGTVTVNSGTLTVTRSTQDVEPTEGIWEISGLNNADTIKSVDCGINVSNSVTNDACGKITTDKYIIIKGNLTNYDIEGTERSQGNIAAEKYITVDGDVENWGNIVTSGDITIGGNLIGGRIAKYNYELSSKLQAENIYINGDTLNGTKQEITGDITFTADTLKIDKENYIEAPDSIFTAKTIDFDSATSIINAKDIIADNIFYTRTGGNNAGACRVQIGYESEKGVGISAANNITVTGEIRTIIIGISRVEYPVDDPRYEDTSSYMISADIITANQINGLTSIGWKTDGGGYEYGVGYTKASIKAKKITVLTESLVSDNSHFSYDVYNSGSITWDKISAGGKITTADFNIADSVIIKDNQSIGSVDITGTSNFVSGIAMDSQKITSLGSGRIADASTDAVNGNQLYALQQLASECKVNNKLTANGDISIFSTDEISVNKTGTVTAGNTGIMTGDTVYNATNTMQSSLDGITSSISKNSTSITSLQDGMADLKRSVASINSTVASTTKNLSSGLTNRLQADLGNLSDDGKSVIKNLIAETLKSMNVSTAAIASTDETSLNTASISSVSIMPTTVDMASTVDPVTASVTSADVEGVYNVLDNKVGKTDFETVKAGVDGNASAIEVNAENIKTNTSAIDTLKTSKANADGSNLDIGAYSAKLGTGKIERNNTGLVNGGAVYSALNQKADVDYVNAGLNTMNNQLDSVKQTVTRNMNRMGANAAALASLNPQDYDPTDKLDFAAGYGHYHDSNATAVGAFYRPNASTMVSLAGTVGNGDSMVSAGLSFKLGMNDKVEKVMISKDTFDKQQVENKQMKGHLNDQTARLQQMEVALSALISR